jgi:signal peptidase I
VQFARRARADRGGGVGFGAWDPGVLVNPKETSGKASTSFIKRIVARPGDVVAIRDGHVVLNGREQKEPFIRTCGGGEGCNVPTPITIPPKHCFMMGDNRGSSDDSRFWASVPRDWIIGNAFATYWAPKRIGPL